MGSGLKAADTALRARFERILRDDAELRALLCRLRDVALPQWRLVAGCLYQTVWNVLTHRPPRTGIRDYDVIYFDAHDLSWEAEDAAIRRVASATKDCVGPIELRNQARVHLWFEQRFGFPYAPLASADEALTRYASIVHAVGVRLTDEGAFDISAPFGLEDLFAMRIRPNRAFPNGRSHDLKAARAKAIWPELTVIGWDGAQSLRCDARDRSGDGDVARA